MANIKETIPLSEWLEFDLDTELLEAAPDGRRILKLRVRPTNLMSTNDAEDRGRISAMMTELVIDAVQEWDLAEDDKPVPCTLPNKKRFLPLLLGQPVKGSRMALGIEIIGYAGNIENFLKK